MREIKFRVWDKESKEMLSDVSLWNDDFTSYLNEHIEYLQDKCELMQYTGLKDKNGIEIYEGDIVKIGIDFGYGTQPLVGEVLFDKCSFVYRHKSQGDLSLFGIDSNDWCEVIGNIYENPELLESK